MSPLVRAYILLHLAVLLFGFTAILGALISLPALSLVWWRVGIASISLLFFTRGFKFLTTLPRKQVLRFSGIGAIIAIHWVSFFASVKLAGASVCLVCMATTCFFLSLIEPLLFRKPFNRFDFFIAFLIVPGMALVVQNIDAERYGGVLAGLFSAFLAAVFSSLNKKYITRASVWNISWIEMTSALLTLSILLWIYQAMAGPLPWWPAKADWAYLLILGVLCTTIAHAMSLFALHHVSAFALNLVINLEPVYGILLAMVLLKENKSLNAGFYTGAAVILIAVLSYPYLQKRLSHVAR